MITRKYKFPTLADYFENEKRLEKVPPAPGQSSDRDTYGKMADRHDVSTTTIYRIAVGLADPSYELALAISKEVSIDPAGMGKSGTRAA